MSDSESLAGASSTHAMRPTLRFLLSHPAHVISLGFGTGLSPIAPGTVGTLLGLLATRYLHPLLGDVARGGPGYLGGFGEGLSRRAEQDRHEETA